ncbi:MAG: ribosomal RNA small subunit methyltransferase A [Calditrichae bacterium]|nr:ribosomal RNA small subunit methyltransferase A [Calditrichota bacterium]MCB9059727.1 ribosomal RNA small subunit methyltransferase A [Calditrichia bacterium]
MQHVPLKKFGQNFLTQPAIAQKIVNALDISNTDTIIEIGPGAGVLTQYIIEKKPAHFTAIEVDPRWADHLQTTFGSPVQILRDDVLHADLQKLHSGSGSFKVIGNIPYNITSPILFKLLDYFPAISQSVLMMQKEVAQRIVSQPGGKDWGILSVLMQTFADITFLFDVGRMNFKPAPKVDSAVLRFEYLERVEGLDNLSLYTKIVRSVFNYRRKMLRNSLIRIFDQKIVSSIDFIDLSRRPEQLSIAEFKQLSNKINLFL